MNSTVSPERVTAVRRFNRAYTKIIGVLADNLVDTPYSLTEARVLFELNQRDATEVADLRRDLELDAGYLSRLLARFADAGLVVRERSGTDARRQVIRLTEAGREQARLLDDRASDQVRELLGEMTEEDQARVVDAMRVIRERFEGPPANRTVVLRPPRPGDYGWVVQRHGAVYAREYGWNSEFEAMVARIVADYVDGHDPAREAAWIAEVDGEPVGSVFCTRVDEHTAKLRALLVEPHARGLGVGGRLVDECVRFARGAGYRAMELWTVDVLAAARRIYQRAGFRLVDEEKLHRFGHDVVGQTWRLEL